MAAMSRRWGRGVEVEVDRTEPGFGREQKIATINSHGKAGECSAGCCSNYVCDKLDWMDAIALLHSVDQMIVNHLAH